MILEIRQYPKVVVTLRIADYTFQPQALFDAGREMPAKDPHDAAKDFSMSFRVSLVKRCG